MSRVVLVPAEAADWRREEHLRDLRGCRPIREWVALSWHGCDACGGEVYAPADEDEQLYDGEPIACPDCGAISSMCVDSEASWVSDLCGDAALELVALAGLRRLLGLDPWTGLESWMQR